MTPAELIALRDELPHCDLGYVLRECPAALRLAERYNVARSLADPDDLATIAAARAAKAKLLAAVA